jgi:hypothetical protein
MVSIWRKMTLCGLMIWKGINIKIIATAFAVAILFLSGCWYNVENYGNF